MILMKSDKIYNFGKLSTNCFGFSTEQFASQCVLAIRKISRNDFFELLGSERPGFKFID